MTERRIIRLHDEDNVVIAADSLPPGEIVTDRGVAITVREGIPYGHKVSTTSIAKGASIRKYGETIGFASVDVEAGAHVHVHNVAYGEAAHDYDFAVASYDPVAVEPRTFLGYRRRDGRVGTRNYVAVISTVNCSAATSRFIAQRLEREILEDYQNVDGILALTHKGGCGMRFEGIDHEQLDRVLGGFAKHPNVGAYLIVGLGCEDGQPLHLVARERLLPYKENTSAPAETAPVLTIQSHGGIRRTVEDGVAALRELLPEADRARRDEVPASMLVLGTQCGGSDAFSGITATRRSASPPISW